MRFVLLAAALLISGMASAQQTLVLASTTSTQNSGLYDYLLPLFEADTGIAVKVIAVGTGQAIRIAENGDADALLVHHRPSEDQFVSDGHGIDRVDVMYNDFVLVGPQDDPAAVASAMSLHQAIEKLNASQPIFISRGDDSGTHKKEQELWAANGTTPNGPWYREIGAGMGAALNMASAVGGYTLSDRGTWLSFGNKGDLQVLFSGDKTLFNPYGLIQVNSQKFPHVQADNARAFSRWITSMAGQQAIAAFQSNGQQLFCPNSHIYLAQKSDTAGICPSAKP